jgi:hypothetical protein
MRTMIDSDNLAAFDGIDVDIIATYADLFPAVADLDAFKAAHPGKTVVLIDRGLGDPLDEATIADIEDRALTVAQLPAWVARKKAAGKNNLTGYCDRNDLPAVLAIERHGLYHWIATGDGTCFIGGFRALRSPAAVQILFSEQTGIDADFSLVCEAGWNAAA